MILATLERLSPLITTLQPIVVTNADHVDAVEHAMRRAGHEGASVILEPVGRNTAPAVAVAAHHAIKIGDPLILILPADHTISDEEAFLDAVLSAVDVASEGYLVTFGVAPSRPETGYGYIKVGEAISPRVSRVDKFREKPDEQTARAYVESGEYLWNAGVFLFRASTYLNQLVALAPDIAEASEKAYTLSRFVENRQYLDAEAFASCRPESIDYAVMEKTDAAVVVPMNPGWDDVGSWTSIWDISNKDDDNNVTVGDVITVGTTSSYIKAPHRLVATVGVDKLIVVDTPDAILIAHMDAAQDVKAVVDQLNAAGRSEAETGTVTVHDWGRVAVVGSADNHSINHVWLDAGQSVDVEFDNNQSGIVSVVTGTIHVSTPDEPRILKVGDSHTVGEGQSIEVSNPTTETAEFIRLDFRSRDDEYETID